MAKGVSLKQPSFAGGIISPQALGRTDQQKYAVGLRTCQNAWVTRYGTIENRPGTGYVGSVKEPSVPVRTVPFVSFLGTSFLLEFGYTGGAGYCRPWKNGARISVVGASAYDGVSTVYAVGDLVTYGGVVYWSKQGANGGHQPDISPTWWYPQAGGLLEIFTGTTPTFNGISAAALASFQYVQQNDVLTLTSQLFTPAQMLHYSDTRWVFQAFAQSTGIDAPAVVAAVAGTPATVPAAPSISTCTGGVAGGGGAGDLYILVSFNATTTSVASTTFFSTTGAGFVATGGSPIAMSWGAVGGVAGYALYKQPRGGSSFGLLALIEGSTSYTDNASITPAYPVALAPTGSGGAQTFTYEVTAISAATGAESLPSVVATCVGNVPSIGSPNVITWSAVTGASKYNIYRVVAGVPGFIGQQPSSPFSDTNILPDSSKQPPAALTLFATANDYPAVCAYYQQRLCFANTINQPSTVWMSKVGIYSAFTVGTPVLDADAISFAIAGTLVQPIQAMVDLGKLIIHTSNGEYQVTGNAAGVLTPSSVGVVNTGSAGSSLIAPVVIGNTDLFVQSGATRLNDLRYEVQRFTFAGKDLTKLSTDLFRGRTIVSMAWQKIPHSIVWCVLDNGTLVGLTYVSEDELWAWHTHVSTNGAFEQVAVVAEGSSYNLYCVVRRTIGGVTARSIERFASRDCIDTVLFTDSVFLDASLTFDGRNTGSTTMTVTTGAGWTQSDTLTITASTAKFTLSDVGNQIVLQQKDATTGLVTDQVSLDILGFSSTTVVTARAERSVPTWARVALTTWGKAVKSFAGIGHLEGQAIGVFADGNVVANPLNGGFPTISVSGGAFTLTKPAMVVTAGLPVQTDIQTLPLENAQGETIANKRIAVRECTPILYASRGGRFGQDSTHLHSWKQPNPASGLPIEGFTGPVRVSVSGTPQDTGQVWIRHTEPTPFGLSAIVITCEIGD